MDVKNKRTGGAKVVFVIAFIVFLSYGLSLLFAFGWGFLSSLKTIREYAKSPFGFPKELQFINYINAFRTLEFEGVTMPMMVWNSIWFSLGSVLLSLFFTALTAYVTSKYRFFGREFLYAFAVFMMIIPTYGTFVATYRLYHELQMVDSYTILLSATGGFTGMNYFLLYSYFKSISSSYSEAASLDGAGHYKIFFSIIEFR
jgi:ABC-type glycerol-3-phosphate transport system permease component